MYDLSLEFVHARREPLPAPPGRQSGGALPTGHQWTAEQPQGSARADGCPRHARGGDALLVARLLQCAHQSCDCCAAASASERPLSVQHHALHLRTKSVSSLKSFARSQCSSLRQPSFARLLRGGLRLEGLPCVLCFSAPLHEGRGRCACCPVLRQISIWERWKSTAELRVAVPAAASRADWVLYISLYCT